MENQITLNGYIGFYNCKRVELYAENQFAAREAALAFFRPPKSRNHMVHVVLAEIEGKPVVHSPDF